MRSVDKVERIATDMRRLAATIVVHNDSVLVVRRSKKERFLPCVWTIPGGKIQIGESSVAAALRELCEETGIEGEMVRFVGYVTFTSTLADRELNNVQFNYLVRPVGCSAGVPEVTLPEKDQAFTWIPTDSIEDWAQPDQHGPAGLDQLNLAAIRQALPLSGDPSSILRTASSRSM